VDVGKIMHVVIGIRTGVERWQVLKVAQLEGDTDGLFHQLHDLRQRYNVKSAVVDIRPYEDGARSFQKSESGCRIYLCNYTETSVQDVRYDDLTGIVTANRTQCCDMSHRVFRDRHIVLPRPNAAMETYILQCCGTARVLETNRKSGVQIHRYREIGRAGDHYRHATNYFLLAADQTRIARSGVEINQGDEYAISDY
jgi:hypothetical protein